MLCVGSKSVLACRCTGGLPRDTPTPIAPSSLLHGSLALCCLCRVFVVVSIFGADDVTCKHRLSTSEPGLDQHKSTQTKHIDQDIKRPTSSSPYPGPLLTLPASLHHLSDNSRIIQTPYLSLHFSPFLVPQASPNPQEQPFPLS